MRRVVSVIGLVVLAAVACRPRVPVPVHAPTMSSAPDTLWPRAIGVPAAAALIDTSSVAITGPAPSQTLYLRSVFVAVDPAASALRLAEGFSRASARVIAEVNLGFLLVRLDGPPMTTAAATERVQRLETLPHVRGAMLLSEQQRMRRADRP